MPSSRSPASVRRLANQAWSRGLDGETKRGWARYTDLLARSVGPSRDTASCARRSPGNTTKDSGSTPDTSTQRKGTCLPGTSLSVSRLSPAAKVPLAVPVVGIPVLGDGRTPIVNGRIEPHWRLAVTHRGDHTARCGRYRRCRGTRCGRSASRNAATDGRQRHVVSIDPHDRRNLGGHDDVCFDGRLIQKRLARVSWVSACPLRPEVAGWGITAA
jgi:hypothetical protein